MDRSLWNQSFGEHALPEWLCPVCHKGHTQLVPKSLRFEENVESRRQHDDEGWDPDWIEYTFTAWGQCSYARCKQLFSIAGTGGVGQYSTEDGDEETYSYFSPKYCNPMPDLIAMPPKCPETVRNALRTAFALYWNNHEACSNRIRVALELLMDHLQVPRKRKTKAGKFSDLTLHSRLEVLSQRPSDVGPQLMALKWLGNTGSHDGQVSRDDLLDAFEILEHTLQELIEQRSARVAALAAQLTRKHAK